MLKLGYVQTKTSHSNQSGQPRGDDLLSVPFLPVLKFAGHDIGLELSLHLLA